MSELSARNKKCTDDVPFDRFRVPPKQNPIFAPILWAYCFFATRSGHLKIQKTRMEGLKPPYIVFGSHHAWMDFYVTPLALFPRRANYVSEMEGFEFWGEWLFRQIGCIGTRKYINDIALVKSIKRVMERRGIVVVYPEARYANVGTSSELPQSVGKLAKNLKVPVVCINMHGNYLQSPIWNTKMRREARLEAQITQLITPEELDGMTAGEVTAKISEYLTYDEYRWQLSRKMRITAPFRAEGLHKVLYRCPECGSEFTMRSEGADLYCESCGSRVTMNEYGQLAKNGGLYRFSHIPDWYEWQRKCVHEEIESGNYRLDCTVHIEALPGAKCFLDCGEGRLVHDAEGFSLTFTEFGESAEKTMRFPPLMMNSIHTEYDYRGWGECVTLSVPDNTYFLFPRSAGFNPTKIQFATEYLHKKALAGRK
ncbi:MAG: 1-acyl-sn-glycerol-3-phosphate acyltransferase [Ruminiclostridium sp.]|nr:1-acyl-sn-glycerol-3-phosphate acyltransferase [Ruminiclostridium sp.]